MIKLFKWFTLEGEDSRTAMVYTSWFQQSFDDECFDGIEKMMYFYLEHSAEMGIPVNRRYLESFLRTDCKRILFSYNIRTEVTLNFDYKDPSGMERAFTVISAAAIQWFDAAYAEDLTGRNFKVDANEFIVRHKKEALRQVLVKNFPRMDSGEEIENVTDSLSSGIEHICMVFDDTKLDDIDFMLGNEDYAESTGAMPFISNTGLPCMNKILGGMQYMMTGATGVGKSRLAFKHFAYIPSVLHGVDSHISSLELSKLQVVNILVAIHIVTKFGGRIKIPDSLMNEGVLTEEMKQYYDTAKRDLFNNPDYGKIYISSDALVCEEFFSQRKQFARLHPKCKIYIEDYLGLIVSEPTNPRGYTLETPAILKRHLTDQRRLCQKAGLSFYDINQYTKEGALKAEKGLPISQGDIEGGQVVQRFADVNIYATQTPEQKVVEMFNLCCDKNRGAKPFNNVLFQADKSISKFTQMKSSEVMS